MSYESKLQTYAEHQLNVLITGVHGIGKSTIVKNIAENMGLKFKYYSSSTLDPWADLVGVPVPDKESKTLEFCRPNDLEDAEFVFFDELNRAHPRVLNTVLEIIQFKSVNNKPLKNLKMVWAAINPPGGDYQVEDMDPALVDRFHVYFKMNPQVNVKYLSTVFGADLAKVLRSWWQDDLDDEQRKILTPRRIEYIGQMIKAKIDYKDAFPPGYTFPRSSLERRLRIMEGSESDFVLDKKNIIEKQKELIQRLKTEPDCGIKIMQQMVKFSDNQLFDCRDLLEALSKELVLKIGDKKFQQRKRSLRKMFEDKGIDYKANYPKITAGFGFEDV